MVSRINLHLPQILTETHNFRFESKPSISRLRFQRIACSRKNLNDADLALDLSTEVAKLNFNLNQRTDAMKKGTEFLFAELCEFQGLKSEEMKVNWKKMDEESKWSLVEKFVLEFGVNFLPLSLRSVKEMVDELVKGEEERVVSNASLLIPGLKRIIGL